MEVRSTGEEITILQTIVLDEPRFKKSRYDKHLYVVELPNKRKTCYLHSELTRG